MIRILLRLSRWLAPEVRSELGPDLDATLSETWRREGVGRGRRVRAWVATSMLLDLARQIVLSRWGHSAWARHVNAIPRASDSMDNLFADVRFALRSVRRAPLVYGVILVTLALGIGGSTTVFTLVNAELLAPLPYRDADRLLAISGSSTGDSNLSVPNLDALRISARSLESVTGFDDRKTFNITTGDEPVRVFGASADAEFFRTLGIEPILGRAFGSDDDRPGAPLVVVLGEALWRRQFAADPEIVGTHVRMNDLEYTVVGVAPASLRVPDREQLWVPLASHPYPADWSYERGARFLEVVARMAPGVTVDAARAELRELGSALAVEFPESNADLEIGARPLRELLVGDTRGLLTALMSAVFAVLLIACVNVAALLIGRAADRQVEFGMRLALGAGRARVVRQLLTEALTISALAGVAGIIVAVWSRRVILAALPGWFPRLQHVGIDLRVLGFAAAMTLGAGLLFGLLPAALMSGARPFAARLNSGSRSHSGNRARRALVVAEVAIALALLIVAGLMVRSLTHLATTDTGFATDTVLTASISLPDARYDAGARAQFADQLVARLERHARVAAVAAANRLPVSGGTNIARFGIEDRGPDYEASAHLRLTTPGLFDALEIALVQGRTFTREEVADGERVVVVDAELAERHWPDGNAVGANIRPGAEAPWFRVIGIVARTRHWGPRFGAEPTLYAPFTVDPASTVMIAVRTAGEPLHLGADLRAAVRALDSQLPVEQLRTMSEAVSATIAQPRAGAFVLAVFAAYALMLAVLGVYGVLGNAVARRAGELGIRMALGARPRSILRLVARDGAGVLGVGVFFGLLAGWLAARAIAGQLYGVSALDPVTFVIIPTVIVLTGAAAIMVPARRAARIDPIECLRTQ